MLRTTDPIESGLWRRAKDKGMKIISTQSLIIGAGPAGYTAGIYLGRYGRQPIIVSGPLQGGQLMLTTEVENFPGFRAPIQGPALMQECAAQAVACGADLVEDSIEAVDFSKKPFICMGTKACYVAETIIMATGASTLWLGLESETHFRGYGVSSCATCDGRFFRGKDVAVVGGGNTAIEEALFLAQHVKSVTIIHRRDSLRADRVLQERAFGDPKISFLWNHVVQEIKGRQEPHKHITQIVVQNTQTNAISILDRQGLFIAIGHTPNTDLVKGTLDVDSEGYLLTEPGSSKTKIAGVFAAGDVQDKIYRQAVTAAGQGCMAAMDAERFLQHA